MHCKHTLTQGEDEDSSARLLELLHWRTASVTQNRHKMRIKSANFGHIHCSANGTSHRIRSSPPLELRSKFTRRLPPSMASRKPCHSTLFGAAVIRAFLFNAARVYAPHHRFRRLFLLVFLCGNHLPMPSVIVSSISAQTVQMRCAFDFTPSAFASNTFRRFLGETLSRYHISSLSSHQHIMVFVLCALRCSLISRNSTQNGFIAL